MLDMVDKCNRSRLRGFETFRLFHILEVKSKYVTDKSENDDIVNEMQKCLSEAHNLLEDDLGAPPLLLKCHDRMIKRTTKTALRN